MSFLLAPVLCAEHRGDRKKFIGKNIFLLTTWPVNLSVALDPSTKDFGG